MKKYFIILVTLLFISQATYSQRWKRLKKEIFWGIVSTNFLGEVGGKAGIGTSDITDLNFNSTRYGVCLGYSYRLNKKFAIQTKAVVGVLYGSDKFTKEPFRNNRNLTFRTPIVDLSVQYNYIFYNRRKEGHRYTIKGIRGKNFIDHHMYIFTGIGGFWFDPYGKDTRIDGDGKWHRLKPLRTEGEGLVPSRKEYSNFQVCIPFGIGMKFLVSRLYSIGVEYSYRKTFTDYIDDCSTTYFDPVAIRDANSKNGDLAVYMANPSPTRSLDAKGNPYGIGAPTTAPGVQRGDPRDKDGYMFLMVTVYYKLPRKGFSIPKF